jgi:hypothetical protein
MSVSSITSSNAAASMQAMTRPEALEPQRAGPDHDGDSDDRATASAPKPVVNTSGQLTGVMVNTKA